VLNSKECVLGLPWEGKRRRGFGDWGKVSGKESTIKERMIEDQGGNKGGEN